MLSEFFAFLTICTLFLFSFVITGSILLRKLFPKFGVIETLVLGTISSVCLQVSLVVFLGLFFGPVSFFCFVLFSLLGVYGLKSFVPILLELMFVIKNNLAFVILSATAVLFFASTILFSGIAIGEQVYFQEIHDSVWHLALARNLLEQIPPNHPAYPQMILNNYHYFYDVLVAGLSKFSFASISLVYFQFMPIVLGLLLLGSAFVLAKKIGSKTTGYWMVFLTLFAGSFAYLIPIFNPGQMWHESSFWVSQTFVMIVNPQVIFTLAVTLCVLFLLISQNINFWKKHLVLILLIASSIGFKSYAFVILSAVYAFSLLYELILQRDLRNLFVGTAYIFFALPYVYIITGFKTGSFFYKPLWFIDSMVEISDRLNYLEWKFKEDHYRAKGNWPRVLEIKLKEIFVFYFGNLGIRSIGFLAVVLQFTKNKLFKENRAIFLIVVGFIFSSVFPLLFLQRGIVWNSIQFWYYALIFANLLAAMVLAKITPTHNYASKFMLVLIIAALSLPTTLQTAYHKFTKVESISVDKISSLDNLSKEDLVLICPDDTILFNTSIVRAYSDAQVYFANPIQLTLLGMDEQMSKDYEAIFSQRDSSKLSELIANQKITKIICQRQSLSEFISDVTMTQSTSVDDWQFFDLSN